MQLVFAGEGEFVELLGEPGGEAVRVAEVFPAGRKSDFVCGLVVKVERDSLPVAEGGGLVAVVSGFDGVAVLAIVVVDLGVEL